MPARLRSFRVQLGLAALLALVVRVGWVMGFGRHQDLAGDQIYYHFQALALAQGDGFANPYAWRLPGHVVIPTAAHPPLYSLYLAVWSALGIDSVNEHRLVSVLLGVATVLVIGLVGRRVAGDRAGATAAVLVAVYPNLWINDGLLAAESVYALTIALVLGAAYRCWQRQTWLDALLLGGAIGLATLARAEGALLFVTLAAPLVLVMRGPTVRRKIEVLGGVAVVGAVVLAPWVVRNLTTWDEPVVLSTGAGFVIEIANCDETYQGRFLGYWSTACDRDSTWPIQADLDPGMTAEERDAAELAARLDSARIEPVVEQNKRAAGLGYMSDHTGEVPKVVLARLGRMWDVWRPSQSVEFNDFFERRGRTSTQAGMAMYYLLLPAAAYGAIVMHRRKVTLVPPVGIALTVCAAAATSFGITRYRVGADVVLCLLAGVALGALLDRSRPGVEAHA